MCLKSKKLRFIIAGVFKNKIEKRKNKTNKNFGKGGRDIR